MPLIALAGWIVDSAPDSNVLPYDATVADLPGVAADPDTHHIFSSAASSEVAGLVSGISLKAVSWMSEVTGGGSSSPLIK